MFRNNSFLIILFAIVVSSAGYSQTERSRPYISRQWNMSDGLPQSSINSIIQTNDGYLWFATFGGLVRFNGETFTSYSRANTKGLRSDRMLLIFEDHSGAIWCSTENGLVRFKDGVITAFPGTDTVNNYSPMIITEDARGVLWISTNARPYRLTGETFIPVQVIDNASLARKAVADLRGTWIAHGSELLRTFGDSIVLVKDFSPVMKNNFQHVVEDPNNPNAVWMATTGSGVVAYDAGSDSMRTFTVKDGIPSNFLRRMYVDHSGAVWACGYIGLSRFDGKRFIRFHTVSGADDDEFNEIFEDREGNYWLGAPSKGLLRARPSIITMIGAESGLAEGKMLSLVRRKDGTFLFGTNCGGIYEYKNGRAVYSPLNASLVNLCVWSLFEDSQQRLWIGSRLLIRLDGSGKHAVVLDSTKGFNGIGVLAIMEDSKRNIWIGCLNGLYRYDGERFVQYTSVNGLKNNDVRSLYEDNSGKIWIGTSDGLHTFENGVITPVPLMSVNGEVLSFYVRAIYQDPSGAMWFGTYGGGLVRLKNGIMSVITTREGLYDNIISHIVDDGLGNFWMGCNRGIFSVRQDELNAVADGMLQVVQTYSYTMNDGMASAETNGGFQPSVARDDSGRIFFPTVSGVAVVATKSVRHNTVVPPVVIEQITADGKVLAGSGPVVVPHDRTVLTIQYAALSYTDQSKVRYRFMLEGFDKDWTDAGQRRTAYYPTIPPGEWTFRVIASNNDGVWNTVGASIPVTVLPPFWMTWWFRTLIVLFFVVSGPVVYYLRVTTLQKEKKTQLHFAEQLIESQEQERRRIAADLHDGLGQQILIIKNRAELAMKSVHDPMATEEQLKEIAESARSSINDVRAISHGLRPVHLEQFGLRETLLHLCGEVQQTSALECVYHIDEIDGLIPADNEINFFRIIQEGINNILKHSGAAQASMMIRHADDVVTASLWDNGKGFEPSIVKEGLGITGIRERAKILGGTCEIKSHPREGTTVVIIIPVQQL